MGWDYQQGQNKKSLVVMLTRWGYLAEKVVAHKVINSSPGHAELWLVLETEKAGRLICLCLLQSQKGYGWGYKSMTEAMGPYIYSCPLDFLDQAPEACPEWRTKVREYAVRKQQNDNVVAALRVGCTVQLIPGMKLNGVPLETACISSLKPLIGTIGLWSNPVKLKHSYIAGVLS